MLHLHLSNRSEVLLQALLHVVADSPADPFAPECIVVEEPGMARWLDWQLAERQGISANVAWQLPAAFLWQVLRRQLDLPEGTQVLNKGSLLWTLMASLPALAGQPGCEPLDHYLVGDDGETRRYQLSRELADLFDQYLVYRPEWIRAWEQGKDMHWQARLWRALREQQRTPHWPGVLEAFRQSLQQQGLRTGALPPRVSLFAVAALSPGYVELLHLLAQHCELHVFLLNPSREYWGDIESSTVLARLRDKWRRAGREDMSAHFSVGNPLLAALGRPRRDFLDLWLGQGEGQPLQEHEHYVPAASDSLLAHIQNDLLELHEAGAGSDTRLITPDASLRVLECYSPLREVEALHDELLRLFTELPGLQPQDIIVMAPDIDSYAPALDAVFSAAPPGRSIPCNIVTGSLRQQPLVELVLGWLRLPTERFAAPVVLGWLELDAVQRRLGLEPDDVGLLRDWVAESAIRWGLDANHKQALQLPPENQNSWDFGLRRLFLGYALPAQTGLYAGVDPCGSVEGSLAPLLGVLQQFLEQLDYWRVELAQAASPRTWQQRLNRLIEQFCEPQDEELLQLDALREALAQLVQDSDAAAFDAPVSAAVLQQHLQAALHGGGSVAPVNGRMTCTSLVALRAVPFRVVCILGLNDGAFPRSRRAPGFDLMAERPRKGDRSLRDDDRLLFLEALLSARDALRLSFTGRSQQDNSEMQPSVVVSELLDHVCQTYRSAQGDLREQLWQRQPLQPFSARAFALGSHAVEWLQQVAAPGAFVEGPLPVLETVDATCRLPELQRFLRNPARQFLEQGLGVRLGTDETTLDSDEPFIVAGLEAYGLRRQLLDLQLQGHPGDEIRTRLLARGLLPGGAAGLQSCAALHAELQPLATQLLPLLQHSDSIEIDPERLGLPLRGRIRAVADAVAVQYRPVRQLKPADLLGAWVEHLALCGMDLPAVTRLFALNEQLQFATVTAEQARDWLAELLTLYRENLSAPVPLLPQASRAWAAARHAGKDEPVAALAAEQAWLGKEREPGDREDAWLALAFRDRNPLEAPFAATSERVWLPLLQSLAAGAA